MKQHKECIGVPFVITVDAKKVSTSKAPFAFIDDESVMDEKVK